MYLREEILLDQNNRPIAGASIYVYVQDGITNGLPATLTTDGTTPLTQPVTSDVFGKFTYYADTGFYIEDIHLGSQRVWENANIAVGSPGADLALRADLAANKTSVAGFETVESHGADPLGVADSTAAFNAASAAAALTGKRVLAGPGTFKITGRVGPFLGCGVSSTIISCVGLGSGFTNSYTLPGSGYALNSAAKGATSVTLTSSGDAANFTVGGKAVVTSTDQYLPGVDVQQKGELVTIKGIAGAVLTFFGQLTDDYTTTPKIAPVTLTKGVEFYDFAVVMDSTVSVVAGSDSTVEDRNAFNIRFADTPIVHNVHISWAVGTGVQFEGCLNPQALIFCKDFGSATNSDGTTSDGSLGGYGYAAALRGLNWGGRIEVYAERCRHGGTTLASFIYPHGRPTNAVVYGSHKNAKLSGFDTHACGYNITFVATKVDGCSGGPAYTNRAPGTKWISCEAYWCIGAGWALYKGADGASQDCIIQGAKAQGTNSGTDAAGTDWTGQACIVDQGDRNRTDGFDIKDCGGYLYDAGSSSSLPFLGNGRAANINTSATVTFAVRLRKVGADRITIRNVILDVANGKVADLVYSDANNTGNVPDIHEFRPTNGTISGKFFNGFGAGTDNYVNWTGVGFTGFRTTFTLNGSTTISLSGTQGENVVVGNTAGEHLVTVTGPNPDGTIKRFIAGVGGQTFDHSASGANTFYLKAGANAVLTNQQSFLAQKRSGSWFQIEPGF